MFRRIIAMLIVCVTVIGLMPLTAFAQSEEDVSVSWDAEVAKFTEAPRCTGEEAQQTLLICPELTVSNSSLDVGDNRFTERESNNSFALADRIYNDYTVSGSISYSDRLDYYKFTVSTRSRVSFVIVSSRSTLMAGLEDSTSETITACDVSYDDGSYAGAMTAIVDPGTYYIGVLDTNGSSVTYMFYLEWTSVGGTTTTTTTRHTHSYGSWIRTSNPGCTSAGEDTRTCSCGDSETRPVDALGHDWDSGVISGSVKLFTCNRCGDTYTETISSSSNSTASTTSSTTKATTTTTPTTTATRPTRYNPKVTRLAGGSRTETAVKISEASFTSAANIIIADGNNYADALAGGSLAYALNAPILLIRNNKLDAATLNEISRLNPQNIYILGGTLAISAEVANSLRQTYNVTRIAGKSRFDTAVEIAKKLQSIKGAPSEIFFAYSHNYPDALAISGIAAIKGCPVLYISADGKLADSSAAFVRSSGAKNATILGGTLAISPNAEGNIKNCGPTNVKRIAGTSRYDTCLEINKAYSSILTGNALCIATGMNYPDALAGGVFAAINRAPMVLVGTAVNQSQIDFIVNHCPSDIYIFGGTGAVPEHIVNSVVNKTPTPTTTTTKRTTTTVNKNMHIVLSTNNLTLQPGQSATVYVTVKNPVSSFDNITRELRNSDIVDTEWGYWDGWTVPITITGEEPGTTYVDIYVIGHKSSTLVSIKVTVPSPVKINLQTTLPMTFTTYYGSTKQVSTYVTDFTYTVEKYSSGYWVDMSLFATKTYDKYGSTGSSSCSITYRLLDSNGIVVNSGSFYKGNVFTGDKFYMEESAYYLQPGTYTLLLSSDR